MKQDKKTNFFADKKERLFRSFFFFLFIALIVLDQLVKNYAHKVFKNYAFAFSLPLPVWLMYLVYTLVLAGIIYFCFKHYRRFNFLSKFAWTIVFAGAFSNIIERIFLGYARDFIYITFYKWTGIYNLADGFIIAGAIILLFSKQDKKPVV